MTTPDHTNPAADAPYDAGDAPTGASFAAYLSATERDRLDTRAATAEQERDDLRQRLAQERADHRVALHRLDQLRTERDQAHAKLRHVGQVLTDWRNTFTDEPHLLQDADRVLVDLIDGGLLPTAERPIPPVSAGLGSPAPRAQGDWAARLAERDHLADQLRAIAADPAALAQWKGNQGIVERDPIGWVVAYVAEWMELLPRDTVPAEPVVGDGRTGTGTAVHVDQAEG